MLGTERKKLSCLYDFTNVFSDIGLVDEPINVSIYIDNDKRNEIFSKYITDRKILAI